MKSAARQIEITAWRPVAVGRRGAPSLPPSRLIILSSHSPFPACERRALLPMPWSPVHAALLLLLALTLTLPSPLLVAAQGQGRPLSPAPVPCPSALLRLFFASLILLSFSAPLELIDGASPPSLPLTLLLCSAREL